MKYIMIETGKVSLNGFTTTVCNKGSDVSKLPQWVKDYFIRTGQAKAVKEVEEVKEVSKFKQKYSRKNKVEHVNKMMKENLENKGI